MSEIHIIDVVPQVRDAAWHQRGRQQDFDLLRAAYEQLKASQAAAVAAEREACRKICADLWTREPEPGTARDCHDEIRARGAK